MRINELFERVTRDIIAAIEGGAGEYRMPWHRWGEALSSPINATTGKPYRGFNILMLWAAAEAHSYSSGRWATYRQWLAAGAQVRKGEKATTILFWKTNSACADADEDDGELPTPRVLARAYRVFNADQVDAASAEISSGVQPGNRLSHPEEFFTAIDALIRIGGDTACYVPSTDEIWMPRFEQFCDPRSYYSVLAHEHVHWTGAKHRVDRNLTGRFGSDAYAMEELVAELGAAFVAGHLKISVQARPDHAAYIQSWLRVLRGDARAVLTASAKAQEAVDYLIDLASQRAAPGGDLEAVSPEQIAA